MKARGFTLIEVLVTLGIAGTLGAALVVSLLIGRNTYLSSSASIDVQQEARRAFQTMVNELREGGQLTSNTNTVPDVDFTDARRLNFKIARSYDTVTCGGICWGSDTANDEWIHYYVGGTGGVQLLRCRTTSAEGAGANLAGSNTCTGSQRVMANNVRLVSTDANPPVFKVTYANASRSVTLSLEIEQLSSQLPGGRMTSGELKTAVKLRNP